MPELADVMEWLDAEHRAAQQGWLSAERALEQANRCLWRVPWWKPAEKRRWQQARVTATAVLAKNAARKAAFGEALKRLREVCDAGA